MSSAPIRVMLVDDSAVIRGLMARAIQSDAGLQLTSTAMHGQSAISSLRKELVDVVVMDVEMPVMDGITALRIIQQEFPGVKVIMASSLTQAGADTTVRALELGAAGCIAKPQGTSATESVKQVANELVPLIKALVNRPAAGHASTSAISNSAARGTSPAPRSFKAAAVPRGTWDPEAVVIGTSTGGPRALQEVLTALPVDFPLPIFIVQHMPAAFTPMLAKHLQQDTKRPAQEARHGGKVEARTTYVAPGEYHLEIVRSVAGLTTRLHQGPAEHFCRPSVNPLFRTAADVFGGNVLAVMLTGMGDDGLEGTRDLHKRGARIIAQDEASSVVWGMPGAIVREGLAHEILPLDQIAPAILRHCLQEVGRPC